MRPLSEGMFRSLRVRNYRLWAAGAFVSNIGTWMQRIAQDWLVLTILTHHNATSVGVVTALQFAPQILLMPFTGHAADHLDRRKLLVGTQGSMAALALGLGALTVTGLVQLWQVYGFALMLGVAAAFDAPVRQAFVSELVGETDLANAVALNSTSFNAARTIGPALAGFAISAVGTGWAFVINGFSTLCVCAALLGLRVHELHRDHAERPRGGFAAGLTYVLARPDLITVLAMLLLFGTFGLNFAVFISTMAVKVFHVGAGQFGLLTTAMACGSVTGAMLAARRERPQIRYLVIGAGLFGVGMAVAAVMPDYRLFGLVLAFVGVSSQTVTTSATGLVQLSTDRHMRGRVMALLMGLTLGGSAAGAPIIGWVADRFGPRWAVGVGAAAGLAAAAIGLRYLLKAREGVTPPAAPEAPSGPG